MSERRVHRARALGAKAKRRIAELAAAHIGRPVDVFSSVQGSRTSWRDPRTVRVFVLPTQLPRDPVLVEEAPTAAEAWSRAVATAEALATQPDTDPVHDFERPSCCRCTKCKRARP